MALQGVPESFKEPPFPSVAPSLFLHLLLVLHPVVCQGWSEVTSNIEADSAWLP